MDDDDFRLAMRVRLGISHPGMPPSCACKKPLDPDHVFACDFLKRKSITTRHDKIRNFLNATLKRAGFDSEMEPRYFGKARIRPDIEFHLQTRTVLTDVAVTHVTVKSHISRGQIALGCATQREWDKKRKYDPLALTENADLHPFVVEHTGAFGASAKNLIRLIVNDRPFLPEEFDTPDIAAIYLRTSIAFLVQKGNAAIIRQGIKMAKGQVHRSAPVRQDSAAGRHILAHLPSNRTRRRHSDPAQPPLDSSAPDRSSASVSSPLLSNSSHHSSSPPRHPAKLEPHWGKGDSPA